MASELDIAMALTGRRRAEDGSYGRELSTTIVGVATSDSSDGSVRVDLGGESVTQDDVQEVEVPTTVEVREGDQVRVTLDGVPGSGRRPTVTGVIGGGDRTRIDVDNAVSDASQAVDTAGKAADTATGAADAASRAISRMAMATCDTAQDVAAKVATVASGTFSLSTGACVQVVFSAANVALSPTLDVGGTGAKPIMTNGTPYAYWVAGSAVSLVYDGASWQVCSTPVYASTVTVGNPAGANVHIDESAMSVRDGETCLATFGRNACELGKASNTSTISMAGGHGKIFGYLDPSTTDETDGITELRVSSDKFLTLHGANEALLYATPSSTVVEYQNSTRAEINVSSEIDGHTFSSDVRLEATAVDETGSDFETKSTITMLASDGATLNGAQILTAPTVLFYNEAQSLNTPISLSYSAGDYTRLKIFYKSDDSDYCSVEVYNPNGKTVALQIARPAYAYAQGAAPVMYVKSKIVKISGATIDTVKVSTYGGGSNYLTMQKNLGSSGSSGYDVADKVGIIRVEGYKW